MKTIALLAPLGLNAHCIFNRLIVNGVSSGGEYAYTRKKSNSYNPSLTNELMDSNDLRCNKGATAGSTATYTVKAGDQLGFKLSNNEMIEHLRVIFSTCREFSSQNRTMVLTVDVIVVMMLVVISLAGTTRT